MSLDKTELLEFLRAELAFVEQGGYGRSVRTPWRPSIVFRDSPSCLNFHDEARPHPCSECKLMTFVPEGKRREENPCHHIVLDKEGETVDSMMRTDTQAEMEEKLGAWLRKAIAGLEVQLAAGPRQ